MIMTLKWSASLLVVLFSTISLVALGNKGGDATASDSITVVKELAPVVVKSQRQTEDLKSVPASVSAFYPSKLEREAVSTVKEVTSRIPNFYMPQYGNKVNSPIYIRGIGSKFNTPGIAFYVDNVPFFEKSTFDFDLFDIGSLEVFRGPQGTLFGRNSMGGVISIYSKDIPSFTTNQVAASFGDRSFMSFKGAHSSSYGKLGVSASAAYTKRDGFFKNQSNGKTVDYTDAFSARVKLKYDASSSLSFKLLGGITLNNDGGNPFKVYDSSKGSFLDVSFDEESYYTRSLAYGAFVVSKKFGGFELRNVSSYQYFQDHQHLDQDYTLEKVFVSNFYQYQHLLTNELVLITPKLWKWSSQTGAFIFGQQMDKGFQILNGPDAAKYQIAPIPRTQNIPGASNVVGTEEGALGVAFFHQSQLSDILTKNLNLVLGARVDFEGKNFDYANVTTLPAGILPPSMNPIVTKRDSSGRKLVFLPKATLSYSLYNQNVYASWGLGYKSGGFNTSYDKKNPSTMIYDPEFAENYEVGAKTSWFGNRLAINAALFYTKWKDQQINVMLPSGQGLMITNAGRSYSKGAELEVNAVPFNNFQMYMTYGFVEAKYNDYTYFDPTKQANVVYDNRYLPFVPKTTLGAGASYRILIGDGSTSSVVLGADFERVGKHYWNDANTFSQAAWFNLNAMAGYTYKKLELVLRAKNITNEKYNAYEFEYNVEKFYYKYAQQGRPRFAYVELSYKF